MHHFVEHKLQATKDNDQYHISSIGYRGKIDLQEAGFYDSWERNYILRKMFSVLPYPS